mmetsp:Transcript_41541/g.97439  ORF Transcript_41541/g.97439 Transcript_41541/m.97439 type:complete len:212 (+) Transcript_41541:3101-3736(+)
MLRVGRGLPLRLEQTAIGLRGWRHARHHLGQQCLEALDLLVAEVNPRSGSLHVNAQSERSTAAVQQCDDGVADVLTNELDRDGRFLSCQVDKQCGSSSLKIGGCVVDERARIRPLATTTQKVAAEAGLVPLRVIQVLCEVARKVAGRSMRARLGLFCFRAQLMTIRRSVRITSQLVGSVGEEASFLEWAHLASSVGITSHGAEFLEVKHPG